MHAPSSGPSRGWRIVAVIGLIAGGVLVALPFRVFPHAPAFPPLGGIAVVDVPLRRPDIVPSLGPMGAISPAEDLASEHAIADSSDQASRSDSTVAGPLPELASRFGPLASSPPPSVRRDWHPTRLKLPDARPKERRHRLTDGDTLERLAERYLGDVARAPEIFAINRDQLAAPDLLPLGKIIRIPPADE